MYSFANFFEFLNHNLYHYSYEVAAKAVFFFFLLRLSAITVLLLTCLDRKALIMDFALDSVGGHFSRPMEL